MNCAWNFFIGILPPWLKEQTDKYRDSLQELRLRLGKMPVFVTSRGNDTHGRPVSGEDLHTVINLSCRYSPWTASGASQGYITAPGGHRIGLCGDAAVQNGVASGIRTVKMLNIRVARDFPGIAGKLTDLKGSLLILGRPGAGKTTLLRDYCRQLSKRETVSVVDERGELFPEGLDSGQALDVLTGCPKPQGIDMVLRTMCPDTIAVDEITAREDCEALLQASWCGVRLAATAHAGGKEDLLARPVYRPLVDSKVFDTVVVLHPDKSWHTERLL